MKTKKLKYKPDFKFDLIGISSTEDDYRISWILNRKTGIEIQKGINLKIRNDRFENIQEFSTYITRENSCGFGIKLISNKSQDGYLIEELRNIDYFVIINSEKVSYSEDILNHLKSYKEISAAIRISPDSLKSREKLLF